MRSMGVEVALDFFPARVTLPSGTTLRPTRVFVADGRVQVYILRNGVAELYYDEPMISGSGSAPRGWDLLVADGAVRVTRDNDCGCGNPLKSYNPWPGERKYMVRL